MATVLENTIDMACTPRALYDYVTRPWLWHEWHPNSRQASESEQALAVGDHFEEVIELQPLSPLPWRLRRHTRYQVLVAEPQRCWEVRGETRDGWLEIAYRFTEVATGTRFSRTLRYETRGRTALLMPVLRGRMAAMSSLALSNLKTRMEGAA